MYYGAKKEIDDKRDYRLKVCGVVNLPDSFAITMPRVKDQGIVNSCVAHSLSTLLEKIYMNSNKKFSTGFIYGYRPNNYSQDSGMYPREALKTLQKIGDVENKYFDHNKEMNEIKLLVDDKLEELQPLAEQYKITSYSRIYTISEIKECLFNNVPVPISIPVYNNLKLDSENKVILPEKDKEPEGYHMVILYGWNKEGFLFQNSWRKRLG